MASKEIIEVKKSDKGLLRELPEKEKPQFVKTPESLLRQTIGRVRQLDLFERVQKESADDITKYIEDNDITSLGMKLSVPERYLIHALQTLVDNPEYIKEESKDSITLLIDVDTFCRAYGVSEYLQQDKYKKFDWKDKKRAIETLNKFTDRKPFLFYVGEKKEDGNYRGVSYKVNVIYESKFIRDNLKKGEHENLEKGDINLKTITRIELKICTWFLGISYVLIPKNLYSRIKKSFKRPSSYLLELVSLLYIKANHREYNPFFYKHSLVEMLHLDNLAKQSKLKRLDEHLVNSFRMVKELGLIDEYTCENTSKGEKITFSINAQDQDLFDIKGSKKSLKDVN